MENKKLRLLVTKKCPNNCALCCNKQFDLNQLPTVKDYHFYNEIMITGGEPLIYLTKVQELIKSIRKLNSQAKIYVYTSVTDKRLYNLLLNSEINGVVVTPHNAIALTEFLELNKALSIIKEQTYEPWRNMSLRLVLFDDIERMMPKDTDLSIWHIKKVKWLEDCPLPEGEDFMRLNDLW